MRSRLSRSRRESLCTSQGAYDERTCIRRCKRYCGPCSVTWGESSYLVMNSKGQIISGDTTRGRITVWTPDK